MHVMPEDQFPAAGQPFIYAGVERAPGGGKKLLFVKTHGRTPLHISISQQDYDTAMRDGGAPHSVEWCGEDCPCHRTGVEHGSSPPLCREGR